MGDLISRKAAIEVISEWLYDREDMRWIDEVLNGLPAVDSGIIWQKLSKIYNMPCVSGEVLGIIGDVMLALDGGM